MGDRMWIFQLQVAENAGPVAPPAKAAGRDAFAFENAKRQILDLIPSKSAPFDIPLKDINSALDANQLVATLNRYVKELKDAWPAIQKIVWDNLGIVLPADGFLMASAAQSPVHAGIAPSRVAFSLKHVHHAVVQRPAFVDSTQVIGLTEKQTGDPKTHLFGGGFWGKTFCVATMGLGTYAAMHGLEALTVEKLREFHIKPRGYPRYLREKINTDNDQRYAGCFMYMNALQRSFSEYYEYGGFSPALASIFGVIQAVGLQAFQKLYLEAYFHPIGTDRKEIWAGLGGALVGAAQQLNFLGLKDRLYVMAAFKETNTTWRPMGDTNPLDKYYNHDVVIMYGDKLFAETGFLSTLGVCGLMGQAPNGQGMSYGIGVGAPLGNVVKKYFLDPGDFLLRLLNCAVIMGPALTYSPLHNEGESGVRFYPTGHFKWSINF